MKKRGKLKKRKGKNHSTNKERSHFARKKARKAKHTQFIANLIIWAKKEAKRRYFRDPT